MVTAYNPPVYESPTLHWLRDELRDGYLRKPEQLYCSSAKIPTPDELRKEAARRAEVDFQRVLISLDGG